MNQDINFIELPCRYAKKLDKDSMEEIETIVHTQQMISGGDFDADAYKAKLISEKGNYEYVNTVVDLSDLFSFNAIDDDNCILRFFCGVSITVGLKYHDLIDIIVNSTKKIITSVAPLTEGDE